MSLLSVWCIINEREENAKSFYGVAEDWQVLEKNLHVLECKMTSGFFKYLPYYLPLFTKDSTAPDRFYEYLR
jgi:hypothetical protein